jgi:50S ribosomal protein L16 3-hydroxylase
MRYHTKMKKNPNRHLEPLTLLGGISAETFLKEYWHKKPLLIRGAMPKFKGFLTPNELAGLACEEDVQSRLISYVKKQWKLEQGPFAEKRFAKLPERDWTLLVQSVNHHLQEANDVLQQFDFIPYARLDDLMVSYAPDGGGVGPHFDSYDVFLLQGCGQRLWRISEQEDLSLVEGAPLRILQSFKTEQVFTLSAGDMLYLPPHVAHWGIAIGDCMTYSIGFRAPSAQELAGEFLNYLQEHRALSGMYTDPNLALQEHPAEIGDGMIKQVSSMLDGLKWNDADVADFLGQYLSEPKSHVVFDAPKNITLQAFDKRMRIHGIQLSFKSQLLKLGKAFYLNGEIVHLDAKSESLMMKLADLRTLSSEDLSLPSKLSEDFIALMHDWYLAGCIIFPQ